MTMNYQTRLMSLVVLGSSTTVGDPATDGLRSSDKEEGPKAAPTMFAKRLVKSQGGGTGCGGVGTPYPSPLDQSFEQLNEPQSPILDSTNPHPRLPVLAPLSDPEETLADTDSPPMFNLAQPPMRGTTG